MGEDAPEFAHSPDGQILELEVVVAKLKPVEQGVPKVQPGAGLAGAQALFQHQIHLLDLKQVGRLCAVAGAEVDKMALFHHRMPLGGVAAQTGKHVVLHEGGFPGVTVVGGVSLHGVHPVDCHGKTEHRLVCIGGAEVRPCEFIVVPGDVLALVVQLIAGGAFANEVQSAADVWLPVYPAVVGTQRPVLKQTLFRFDGVVGAAAGKTSELAK